MQKKLKIYLAKSKMTDMDVLMSIRSYLAKFSSIEVVEFYGGTYTSDLLLASDFVLVLLRKDSCIIKGKEMLFTCGKGQHTEISLAIESKTPVYIVTGIELNSKREITDLSVVNCIDLKRNLLNQDWILNYAQYRTQYAEILNLKPLLGLFFRNEIEEKSDLIVVKPMLALSNGRIYKKM